MVPSAVLITRPVTDFGTFLGLCQEALGYNPSKAADESPVKRSTTEKFLSCLAAMRDEHARPGLHLLDHVSFSVLVGADERDMLLILQLTGMPFVVADTVVRGVQLAVVTGTLRAWRDAVKAGSSRAHSINVRALFNSVMLRFQAEDIDAWTEFDCQRMPDHTLLLEDKRR